MYIVQYVWEAERESKKKHCLLFWVLIYFGFLTPAFRRVSCRFSCWLSKQTKILSNQRRRKCIIANKHHILHLCIINLVSIGLENMAKNIIIILARNIYLWDYLEYISRKKNISIFEFSIGIPKTYFNYHLFFTRICIYAQMVWIAFSSWDFH